MSGPRRAGWPQRLMVCRQRLFFFDDSFTCCLTSPNLACALPTVFCTLPFACQPLVAQKLAGDFLDLPFRLFDLASNLVFVRAHDMLF